MLPVLRPPHLQHCRKQRVKEPREALVPASSLQARGQPVATLLLTLEQLLRSEPPWAAGPFLENRVSVEVS